MEDGGQKSRGAGGGGAVKEIRKEEDTKQLGCSLSHSPPSPLLSLSHQSSHHSLSSLSVSPCVSFAIVCFVCVEREREKGGHTTAVEYDGGEGQSTANKCLVL